MLDIVYYIFIIYSVTLRELIVRGELIQKRGVCILSKSINRESVNKWEWVGFFIISIIFFLGGVGYQ